MPLRWSPLERRRRAVACIALVVLGTGACGDSDGPSASASASASSPSPSRSIDHMRIACDIINTARRDYFAAVELADVTFNDPDATPAEIHDQVVNLDKALAPVEKRLAEGAMSSDDSGFVSHGMNFRQVVENIRFAIKAAGDDPQKIQAALRREPFKKYERRVLDRCQGHYSSPETPSRP